MKTKYDDIIRQKRPISTKHAPMPREKRAAQFAPFAALTGHYAELSEVARLTKEKQNLSEQEIEKINARLYEALDSNLAAKFTVFVPDEKKKGGSFKSVIARIQKIDEYSKEVVLEDKSHIAVENIQHIEILEE